MSSWGAALRIARRDARRAKGRSLLVVAMIALPVVGVTAVDVVFRTDQLSAEQTATRTIGQADGVLRDSGFTAQDQYAAAAAQPRPDGARPDLAAALPPGSSTLMDRNRSRATVSAGDRSTRSHVRELAYDDPLARGIFEQVSGRAPAGPGEAALTTALASRLGVGLGGTVGLPAPAGPQTVVGLVASTSMRTERTLLVDPGSLAEPTGPARLDVSEGLLFDVPGDVDLALVAALNADGVVVEPRRPVPGAPVLSSTLGLRSDEIAVLGLVVSMALLEVVLLAGPAFAVGAKRQARQLALLSATGAERKDVRRTVLAGGLVLGVVAGAIGLLGGVVTGAVATGLVDRFGDSVQPPLDLRPVELLGIAATGVLAALLAAVVPARNASRQDVVGALTGRRGAVTTSWRLTGLGVVVALAGAGVAFLGAVRRDTTVLVVGSVLAELGLVATTPALVGLAGRLGPLLPVAPRLALRDASRQRSRTAPAVAAILAAVAGSIAVGTFVTSLDAYDEERYQASAPAGSVRISLVYPEDVDRLSRVADAMRAALPVDQVLTVDTLTRTWTGDGPATYVSVLAPTAMRCPLDGLYDVGGGPTEAQATAAWDDSRCNGNFFATAYGAAGQPGSPFGGGVVGGADALAALTGSRDPALVRVLEAGGALVPAAFIEDGRVGVRVMTSRSDGTVLPGDSREASVPAAALPPGVPLAELWSPGAAAALGTSPAPAGVLATTTRMPTDGEEDRLTAALAAADVDSAPYVERGYVSDYGVGLVALAAASAVLVLGASGIATGLAAADGRADLATLAAVGASPALRRRLAAFQSAVTAVLGTALGVVAGLVPAYGLIVALNSSLGAEDPAGYPLVVPWALLLVTAVVVPLLAALAAGALTRSRLPMVRRTA